MPDRRQDKAAQARKAANELRVRFKRVLATLGLLGAFERMPATFREQIFENRNPDPVLHFDRTFPADAAGKALREKLEANFRRATMSIPITAELATFLKLPVSADPSAPAMTFSVRDYYAFVVGMQAIVYGTAASILRDDDMPLVQTEKARPASLGTFVGMAKPLVEMLVGRHDATFTPLHEAVIVPLVEKSRLDGRLLWSDLRMQRLSPTKQQVVMTVYASPPQTQRVTLDGETRPAMRVADVNTWNGIQWLSVNGEFVGRDVMKDYPVYVQSHALRQLHARVNLPTYGPWLEYWLHKSMTEPEVVERSGRDLLVGFDIHGARLGYLVVAPLADCLVVRTFLFLTMEPSPEARRLKKKLKVTRDDIDWLRLNELSAFTQTDLKSDPVLRPLLEACGCGQLFDFAAEDGAIAARPKPLAAEMKKYLRLAA